METTNKIRIMNVKYDYAIKELKNYARIMRGSIHTERVSYKYQEAAECIENQTINAYEDEIIDFLEATELILKRGLKTFGVNYQKEKKRQQNRLKEVQNAIRLCKSNNEVIDGLKDLAKHINTLNRKK